MIIFIVILTALFLLANYFLLIPMGAYWSSYLYFGVIAILIISTIATVVMTKKNSSRKKRSVDFEDQIGYAGKALSIGAGIYVVIALCIMLFNSALFRANSLKNLLSMPAEKEFSQEITPFDVTKAPIVTESTASQIADKAVSQDATLGSRAEIGPLTLQSINDQLYWVAPLEHSGFFAWNNNKEEGTPYVTVNATTKDVKLVKSNIRIQPGSFFGQDLSRVLYFHDKSVAYTDYTFEVDDKGHPYWTATIMKNTVGFHGSKAVGVALVDAETGEIKDYTIDNAPAWIDRIQPVDIVVRNINYRGAYIHGFSPFNNNGKIKATDGVGLVYNNGKCYYYTGITSVGKDESSMGFYLVDTRTMETTFFRLSGATEKSAISSAEGKVQNLGYKGTFPILMNVGNVPTYFIPLQDKNNLTKLYAMVNVSDYTLIATGETVDETKEAYLKLLSDKSSISNSAGDKKEITGTVVRIGSYIEQGDSYYTVTINNTDGIFIMPISLSKELPLTNVGDNVSIKYVDSKNGTNNILNTVSSFDNVNVK